MDRFAVPTGADVSAVHGVGALGRPRRVGLPDAACVVVGADMTGGLTFIDG
jgi:hypothetical protein